MEFLEIKGAPEIEKNPRRVFVSPSGEIGCWVIHKCASSSITSALKKRGFKRSCECDEGVKQFAVMRNPYSRMVSSWLQSRGHLNGNDTSRFKKTWFPEFVMDAAEAQSDPHWAMQVLFLPWKDEKLIPFILHTEDNLSKVLSECLEVNVWVPRRNQRGAKKKVRWWERYTQELADTVYERYRMDFEVGGYDRESWRV